MADAHNLATLPESSLIVPSRGRPEYLLGTVRSILEGEEVPTELIIVDQSDAPDAALMALTTNRPCTLDYRWAPLRGVSKARNTGIAAASYDVLVFTDDDVLVTAGWFGSIVRALVRGGRRTVVSGRVLSGPRESADGFAPSLKEDMNPATYTGRLSSDVLYSGNMALFRSAIAEVGAFDEDLGPGARFLAAEDNDLGFRLLEAGYRIEYVPDAALYHLPSRGRGDLLPLYWSYAQGQGAFYAKHTSLRDYHMMRRLRRSLANHTREIVRTAVRERRFATDHGVYILGLVAGVTRWVLTPRTGKPSRGAR